MYWWLKKKRSIKNCKFIFVKNNENISIKLIVRLLYMVLIVKVLYLVLVGVLDDKDFNGFGICVYLFGIID